MGNLLVKLHLKDERKRLANKFCDGATHAGQPFTCRDMNCGMKPVICIACGF